MLLCGPAAASINMAGTWQFTVPVQTSTVVSYTGPLVQVGNNLSSFAPFAVAGSTCATSATVSGNISDTGAVTINVTLNGQSRVLTGTISPDGNSASGTYTTNPGSCITVTSGAWTGARAQQVLPQFAFGGGWYSALYFSNEGTNPASLTVTFLADDGTPLNVPSVGGSSTTVTLSPNGTAIIEAPNVGNLSEGSVLMALPGGVVGYGIFRQSVPGVPDQEAVVPLSKASTVASRLIWDDTTPTTAMAILNPGPAATTVTVVVQDTHGNLLGTSALQLAPGAKMTGTLRGLQGVTGVAGTRGSADFTPGSGGNVAVLGLRFGGAAFTSIPTADR